MRRQPLAPPALPRTRRCFARAGFTLRRGRRPLACGPADRAPDGVLLLLAVLPLVKQLAEVLVPIKVANLEPQHVLAIHVNLLFLHQLDAIVFLEIHIQSFSQQIAIQGMYILLD